MKKQIFTLLLAIVGINLQAQTYCAATNSATEAQWAKKLYFIKVLSTTGANQNIGITNGTYPAAGAGYLHDQSQVLKLSPGQTLTLNIENNFPASGTLYSIFGCWIDFNGDGDFEDAGELITIIGNVGPSADNTSTVRYITLPISIPETVTLGNTRMRFRYKDSWAGTVQTPTIPVCGAVLAGTTYDFDLLFETVNTDVEYSKAGELELSATVVDKYLRIESGSQTLNANDVGVKIYNLAGSMLKSAYGTELNVSDLPASMYFVHINYLGEDTVRKVLVVR
ncbi:MAG: GEVED domain-containing protein [Paludibacteraceae bacterium]